MTEDEKWEIVKTYYEARGYKDANKQPIRFKKKLRADQIEMLFQNMKKFEASASQYIRSYHE